MNTEKATTKKSKFAIFNVMARLLYVLWNLTAGLILFLEAISLIWMPYWLFTGKWIFEPTLKWIWKVDEYVNVPLLTEYGNKVENQYIPNDAHSFEVFAIKDSEDSPTGKQAFIGFKLDNGNFHFIGVPYTEPKKTI